MSYPSEPHNVGTNRFETWCEPMDFELSPGVVDDDAECVFTQGHCHSFALAVCALVPGARAKLAQDHDHIVAEVPGVGNVDVTGVTDEPTVGDVTGWRKCDWSLEGYKPPRPEDALPWAETVLNNLGVDYLR